MTTAGVTGYPGAFSSRFCGRTRRGRHANPGRFSPSFFADLHLARRLGTGGSARDRFDSTGIDTTEFHPPVTKTGFRYVVSEFGGS